MLKRTIGILLILALAAGLVPGMGVTAKAEEYKLYVSGVQVTSDAPSGAGWAYEASTNTLTLNGYSYAGEGIAKDQYEVYAGILYRAKMNLTIVLEGSNTITMSEKPNDSSAGIYSTVGKITIKGSGSLTVTGGNAGSDSYGIYARQSLVEIQGGTVNATGGAAVLSQYGKSAGLAGAGITVSGGTVVALGGEAAEKGQSIGIDSDGELTIEGGSTVASGKTYGMTNVIYTGGSLVASGLKSAVNSKARNKEAGTGWTDAAGTQGAAEIPASNDWKDISSYLKVQFPAGAAPQPQPEPQPEPEPEPQPEPQPDAALEKIKAFVKRCYKLILNRDADEGGLNGWSSALKDKTAAAAQIIDGFVSSDEFKNRNLSAGESVDILYKTMLDRAADEGGKAGWVDALNQGYTLKHIINGFCTSSEFATICKGFDIEPGTVSVDPVNPQPGDDTPRGKIEAFVKRCYSLILGREADADGLKGWSDALEQRTAAAAQIIDGFVRSDEFVNRNLSSGEKVDILYNTMLGRAADEAGRAGWVDALGQGFTLQHIINGFCGSQEFTTICDNYGIVAGSVAVSGAVYNRVAIDPNASTDEMLQAEVEEKLDKPVVSATVTAAEDGTMQADGFGQLSGKIITIKVNMNKVPGANRYFVAPLRRVAPGNNLASFEKTGEGTMPTVVMEEGQKPMFETSEGLTEVGPNGETITQDQDKITIEKKVCVLPEEQWSTANKMTQMACYKENENIVIEAQAYSQKETNTGYDIKQSDYVYIEIPATESSKGKTYTETGEQGGSTECEHEYHWVKKDEKDHEYKCSKCNDVKETAPHVLYAKANADGNGTHAACIICDYDEAGDDTGLDVMSVPKVKRIKRKKLKMKMTVKVTAEKSSGKIHISKVKIYKQDETEAIGAAELTDAMAVSKTDNAVVYDIKDEAVTWSGGKPDSVDNLYGAVEYKIGDDERDFITEKVKVEDESADPKPAITEAKKDTQKEEAEYKLKVTQPEGVEEIVSAQAYKNEETASCGDVKLTDSMILSKDDASVLYGFKAGDVSWSGDKPASGDAVSFDVKYKLTDDADEYVTEKKKAEEESESPAPVDAMAKIRSFVSRCYRLILNREPDEEGLEAWSKFLKDKTATAAQIIDGFVRSPEYVLRNLSNGESVDILYRTMLDREADADGRAGWVTALSQGYSLQNIIDGFCGSAEFTGLCREYDIEAGRIGAPTPASPDTPRGKIEAFVRRCYNLILGRDADQAGLKAWSDALEQRTASAAEIIDGFVRSEEYVNRNLAAGDSVDILYKTMLDREADADGRAGWVTALSQGYTLQHIINGFCGSPEFTTICNGFGIVAGSVAVSGEVLKREAITPEGEEEAAPVVYINYTSEYTNEEKVRAFVERCYASVFGREGDAEGIGNYTRAILEGKKSPKRVAYEFIFSPEFRNNLPGNEEFIRILYRLYFDRDPGAEELSGWVQMLEDGTSLEDIVNGFAGSEEFKAIVNAMKK